MTNFETYATTTDDKLRVVLAADDVELGEFGLVAFYPLNIGTGQSNRRSGAKKMKTIRWNAKKQIEALVAAGSECLAFSLDNHFSGQKCPVSMFQFWLDEERENAPCHRASLSLGRRSADHGRNPHALFFRVSVHSNLWFDLMLHEADVDPKLVEAAS